MDLTVSLESQATRLVVIEELVRAIWSGYRTTPAYQVKHDHQVTALAFYPRPELMSVG